MTGKSMNWEKQSAERRMKKYGSEDVHEGGYSLKRQHQGDAKAARRVLDFIRTKPPPIEDVVEANGAARASKEAHMRGILDACED